MSATDVTAKEICERLVLVPGLRLFAPFVTMTKLSALFLWSPGTHAAALGVNA